MRLSTRGDGSRSNERGIDRATIAALLAALLFGAGTPAAKALLGEIDAGLLAGSLYLGSGLAIGVLISLRSLRSRRVPQLDPADAGWLVGAIAAGGVVAPLLLLWGLSRTTASSAALVLVLEAPLTALWARLVFREHVGRRAWEALLLLSGAAAATVAPGQGHVDWIGVAAVALACVAWGLDNNLTREAARADAMAIAAAKGLIGGAVNVALALWAGARFPSIVMLLCAGFVGALAYGASLVLYVAALRGLGAARTSAYFATAPFIGAAASVVVLGEAFTPWLGAAAILGAIGVVRLRTEGHGHDHRHPVLVHAHMHVHDAHHLHEHSGDEGPEPHSHPHRHAPLEHDHPHVPDLHHRHEHG